MIKKIGLRESTINCLIPFVLHPRVINQHALLFIYNNFFYGDLKCLADSTIRGSYPIPVFAYLISFDIFMMWRSHNIA